LPGLALALVAAVVAPAAADPAPDRATQAKADALFEKAVARYDAGDYAAAIPMLEDAYVLVHDPVYLFNIAQSYRKTFDCEHASDYYARYLSESKAPPNRAKVEQWLHELEPCVAQRKDEKAKATAAEAEAKARADAATRAEAAARAAAAAAAQTQPRPATPGGHVVDGGRTFRIGGIVLAGAGAAALIVAGGFARHGSTLEADVKDACSAGCAWNVVGAQDEAGKRANTIAKITAIGGGAAVIGGAVLFVLGRSRAEHVEIEPTRGGGVVSARLRF